jgi:F420-non-reducing hydrogenase iron-sulfur subunit
VTPSNQPVANVAQFEPNIQPFEPRVVGFLCNWCSYAGADKAGAAQLPCPSNLRIVRVMCSGRVDPQFVLKAYQKGADGVLILACHPGDCHYKEGNYRAAQRHRLLLRLLRQFGIGEERCRFDYVSAGEGEKFVNVATEMVNTLKRLGPLSLGRTRTRGTQPAGSSRRKV